MKWSRLFKMLFYTWNSFARDNEKNIIQFENKFNFLSNNVVEMKAYKWNLKTNLNVRYKNSKGKRD